MVRKPCGACRGTGEDSMGNTCNICNGGGAIVYKGVSHEEITQCPRCGGGGLDGHSYCPNCNGEGWTRVAYR